MANSKDQYKKAYNILMDYWNYFPDEDKEDIHKRLNEIFGSHKNNHEPDPDVISRVLKRLKKQYGFGKK